MHTYIPVFGSRVESSILPYFRYQFRKGHNFTRKKNFKPVFCVLYLCTMYTTLILTSNVPDCFHITFRTHPNHFIDSNYSYILSYPIRTHALLYNLIKINWLCTHNLDNNPLKKCVCVCARARAHVYIRNKMVVVWSIMIPLLEISNRIFKTMTCFYMLLRFSNPLSKILFKSRFCIPTY